MALTFRKTFNSNKKRDVLLLLKEVIHSMRIVIEGQTRANAEAAKWYLSLNMNFCKLTRPVFKTDPAVTFCSNVFKSIGIHELNYEFQAGYNKIVLQINEFHRNGIAWVGDLFQHLHLQSFTKYLRLNLVFMWNSALREKFFKSLFPVLTKFLFCQGDWALGFIIWSLDTFLIFPNFLRSFVFSRSTTPEANGIYHVYK